MNRRDLISIASGLALIVLAVGYLIVSTKLDARAGCERGKTDRKALVGVITGVRSAFAETDRRIDPTKLRRTAEAKIDAGSASLRSRTGKGLDCKEAYPIIPIPGIGL